MRRRTLAILFAPLAANVIACFGAFYFFYDVFKGESAVAAWFAIGTALAAVTAPFAYFQNDLGPGKALLALIGHAICLILGFAAIYRGFGVHGQVVGIDGQQALDPVLSAYFSIVTWTTLGYGDYRPAESLRLVAGLEASLGYVFLGLIVGLAANLMSSGRSPSSTARNQER
jgi:hypothetical protein